MKRLLLALVTTLAAPALADDSSFDYPLVAPYERGNIRIESAVGCRNLRTTIRWLDSAMKAGMDPAGSLLPGSCNRLYKGGIAMTVSLQLVTTSETDVIIYRITPRAGANFIGAYFVFNVMTETF